MPTNFIVLCTPRTGSYHLTSLLDSAPDIVCHGELFKARVTELSDSYKAQIGDVTPEARDAEPLDYVRNLRRLDRTQHFGFKLFPQHTSRAKPLRRLLGSRNWKVVGLYRDPIEVYASLLRARQTMRWTQRSEAPADTDYAETKVRFEPASFEKFAKGYGNFLSRLSRNQDQPGWFIIRYDQINDPEALDSLLRFIGSKAGYDALSSTYEKQYPRPISEAFENWADLQRFVEVHHSFPSMPKPSLHRSGG